MAVLRLASSNFRFHKIRLALTVAAVALSVSLVVSVTSGYASVLAAAQKFLDQYLGSTDAQITQKDEDRSGVPETLLAELRRDPRVKRVTGRLESESRMLDKEGKELVNREADLIGIKRPDDTQVEQLKMTGGAWFLSDTGNEAVIDQGVAGLLKVGVGDTITLPGINGKLELKVVGTIHKPAFFAAHVQMIYVPLKTLQQFAAPEAAPFVTRAMIDLNEGVDPPAFEQDWKARLEKRDPNLRIKLTRESRKDLDRNLQGIHILSLMGGMVSMLAATFIVFSSLSMGVAERQRTLAMLRAIGAFKSQIGTLVVMEGLVLAGLGILVGVPLGWFWVKLLSLKFPFFFPVGVVLSTSGLLLGVVGSLAAALLASFLPAWSAMRVSPLEAMSPLSRESSRSVPLKPALIGLVCIALDPLVLFVPWPSVMASLGFSNAAENARLAQFYAHFAIGLPGIMLGYFLLAPLFVLVCERLFGPLMASMLAVRPVLLRQQLTGGIWRAAGTASALMVGLAVLVVMQVQGQSMLNSWKLPNRFPDIFIYSRLTQMRLDDMHKIENVPGIKKGEVMPITLSSPEFGSNIFAIAGATLLPNATMFFGVDPDKAFDLIELDFRAGNPTDAKAMLKKGRHLIVTEEFRKLKGLTVGDKLSLKTPRHGVVDYTIAAVVWSPGIDVMVGVFDLGRQFEQRTIASVFGSIADAREDFGVNGVYIFAANLEYFVAKEQVLADVKKTFGQMGLDAGDVRQIKATIQDAFGNLLLLVSSVAFAAMGVSSLGVTNTIMASIRSRRWQFGILRSIGVTQSQLLRLVVAEALLLGLIGCALGLVAGGHLAIDARQLNLLTLGVTADMVVPWSMVLIGVAGVTAAALLASLWPAIGVSRQEPLTLLQAGRAAS